MLLRIIFDLGVMRLHTVNACDRTTELTIGQYAVTARTAEEAEKLLRDYLASSGKVTCIVAEIGTNHVSGPARVLGRVGEHWERVVHA